MPGRSIDVTTDDQRASHGVDACLDAARGRHRLGHGGQSGSRYASGGLRLSRKQRLPAKSSHIARIAAVERRELQADLEARRNGKSLSPADWEGLDTCYWCTCGLLQGYQHLEHHGWIDDVQHAFFPVVDGIAKLKRLKAEAMERLGLDRDPEPRDVWSRVLAPSPVAVDAQQRPDSALGEQTAVGAGERPLAAEVTP